MNENTIQDWSALEDWIEGMVVEWIYCQYGWGWSAAGEEEDFGFMEGSESIQPLIQQLAMPNTIRQRRPSP